MMHCQSWCYVLKVVMTGQCGRGLLQDKQQTLISAKLLCRELGNLYGTYKMGHSSSIPKIALVLHFLPVTYCNIFANLISICSLNRAGFSDIGHAHFCCTFRSLNRHICKTYFFKLLLQFRHHLPESPDVSDEKLSKQFWHSKKSASYNQAIFFAS